MSDIKGKALSFGGINTRDLAPQVENLTLKGGDGKIDATFSAVDAAYASLVKYYVVTANTHMPGGPNDGVSVMVMSGTGTLSCVLSGLENGVIHHVRVFIRCTYGWQTSPMAYGVCTPMAGIEIGTLPVGSEVKLMMAGTVTLENLVQNGSFESMTGWATWNTNAQDSMQAYIGSHCLKLTGDELASRPIATPIIGHKYYAREYIKTSGDIQPSDCRFEIHAGDGEGLNWVFGWNRGNYPNWTIISGVHTIQVLNASSYAMRTFALGVTSGTIWIDGVMLLDLTAAFGAGNEPAKEWCDENIPYFEGSTSLNYGQIPYNHLIVHQGNPDTTMYDASCNGAWLLIKDIYNQIAWTTNGKGDYSLTTSLSYLNTTYFGLFDPNVQTSIKQIKIPYVAGNAKPGVVKFGEEGVSCRLFWLSAIEVGFNYNSTDPMRDGAKLDYFDLTGNSVGNAKRIGLLNGAAYSWLLRSGLTSLTGYFLISETGTLNSAGTSSTARGSRPALILPPDFRLNPEPNPDGSYSPL